MGTGNERWKCKEGNEWMIASQVQSSKVKSGCKILNYNHPGGSRDCSPAAVLTLNLDEWPAPLRPPPLIQHGERDISC